LRGVFAAVSGALTGLAGVFAVGAGAGAAFSSAGALALLTGVFVNLRALIRWRSFHWGEQDFAAAGAVFGAGVLAAAGVLLLAVFAGAATAGVAAFGATLDFSGVFAAAGALAAGAAGFLPAWVFESNFIAETFVADLLGALFVAAAVLAGGFLLGV